MNVFDWVLIAILAYSIVLAFIRGIVRELFSLCGLVAGIALAGWNYHSLAPLLERLLPSPAVANVVAFLLIAVGVMIACAVLGKVVHRTAQAVGLGFLNRLLGAAFGFLRGYLLGVAIVTAVLAFLPQSTWISESRLSSYFLAGAHAVSFVVPHDLQQLILDGVEQLKHNTPDWIKPHQ